MKFIVGLYRFFCSLALAICILSILIVLLAIGTIYESMYGRIAAQEIIYQSVWMTAIIFLLALNIIAVMIDRWPWQKKHIGFLMAHFGILFVITGAWITRYYGVDGSLRLAIKESGHQIMTDDILFAVYSSFDGKNLTELHREKVSFFRNSPRSNHPYTVGLGSSTLKVVNYHAAAIAREQYKPAQQGGTALRFHIEGKEIATAMWLFKPPGKKEVRRLLGPAQIILSDSMKGFSLRKETKPTLVLASVNSRGKMHVQNNVLQAANSVAHSERTRGKKMRLRYWLYHPSSKKITQGFLKIGSVLKTGWMDFQFRILSYLPRALPDTQFIPQKRVTDNTVSAIELDFKDQRQWMGLNSHVFFFEKDKVFIVAYVNSKKSLNFNIKLEDFKIRRYPSSLSAAAYESKVSVSDHQTKGSQHIISMNDPMKLNGWTVYQAGFEQDDRGRPVASVFAINKDPGRILKYFGSFLIVLGSIILFLRRRIHLTNIDLMNHRTN